MAKTVGGGGGTNLYIPNIVMALTSSSYCYYLLEQKKLKLGSRSDHYSAVTTNFVPPFSEGKRIALLYITEKDFFWGL